MDALQWFPLISTLSLGISLINLGYYLAELIR